MFDLFRLIIRGPWYIPAALGVLIMAFAAFMYVEIGKDEVAKAKALTMPQPDLVALHDFKRDRDVHLADEVNLLVRADMAHNTKLVQTTLRKLRSSETVRFMYLLFGPTDPTGANEARAAIILTEGQLETFGNYLDTTALTSTADEILFPIAGEAKRSATLDDLMEDRMEELGVTKASQFFFIDPWLNGREAALQPSEDVQGFSLYIGGAGFLLMLLAAYRFRARAKWRATQSPEELAALKAAKVEVKQKNKARARRRALIFFTGTAALVFAIKTGAMSYFFAFLPLLIVGGVYYFIGRTSFKAINGLKSVFGGSGSKADIQVSEPAPAPMSNSAVETVSEPEVKKGLSAKLPSLGKLALPKVSIGLRGRGEAKTSSEPPKALEPSVSPKKGFSLPLPNLKLPELSFLSREPAKLPDTDPFERFAARVAAQKARPQRGS